MKVTMNMSSHEIEHDTVDAEYGDDILYAGWNPEVDKLNLQLQLAPAVEQRDMSNAPSKKVPDLFIGRKYHFLR
jgi:hypothetical protein